MTVLLNRHIGTRALALAAALVAFAFAFTASAHAEEPVKGELRLENANGFIRLVFRFDQAVPAQVRLSWPIMVIEFKQLVAVSVEGLHASAPQLISAARMDPDGTAIRIALGQKVKINTIAAAERFYVDLMPENWSGVLPGLPQEVVEELARRTREAERQLKHQRQAEQRRKVPAVRVRVATQPTFTRYVFDLPDIANVVPERADDRFTLSFDQPIKWDLADALSSLPPTLTAIEAKNESDSGTISFVLNGTPDVRSFREDRSIVIDVSHEGGKPNIATLLQENPEPPKKAAPALAAVPAIAPPATIPANDAPAKELPPPAPSAAAPPPKEAAPVIPAPAVKVEAPPVPKAEPVKPDAAPKVDPPKAAAEPKAELPPLAPIEPLPKLAQEEKAAAPPAPTAPPPKADGTVTVNVSQASDNLRLEFPFVTPTPAAVFARADVLWLVFDTANKINTAALIGHVNDGVRAVTVTRGADGEAIVRLKLSRPRLASIDADGPAWIVSISDSVKVPSRPLNVARSIVGKNRANIVVPFDKAARLFNIADPDIGDRLMVVTALSPARGFMRAQDYVELHTLASTQGIAVHPIADDITAEITDKAIIFSRPGGLSLSTAVVSEPEPAAVGVRSLTFDTQLWGFDRKAEFGPRQSELIRLAADAPPGNRRRARFNLARFYLARGMSSEAKGVLDVAIGDGSGVEDITGSVLSAVANVMLDRPDEALKELAKPAVGNQLDAPVWRAVALARQGKWAEARDGFKNVDAAIAGLPIELQRVAMMAALRAAIEAGDLTQGARLSNEFGTVGLVPELDASFAVLTGRLDQSLGRIEDALVSYHAAATSSDRRAAAQGRLHEITLRLSKGEMSRKDAIPALETLTTVWRGDETEIDGLKLLAHLYTEEGRYREAFHVMRSALLTHPNSELTRKIQDEAAISFDSLFLSPKGDAMKPVEALALFYDYRQLTPIGRRGDEMIRRLADRLVGVDLLDQAAELLQHQIDKRLQGAARAQVATRLATIYLMNHKPDRALAALKATRSGELGGELREQRLLLEARALSDIGRHDLALELIANIQGPQALRLRADILWAAKRWRAAAEQIELLLGERWQQFEPLNDGERFDVLRVAIGYALSDETLALVRFRERYAAKMAGGPDAHAFEVVSAPIGAASGEFKDVAQRIAGSDTLDAFLADMRKRYPDAPPPADATVNAAAPPAAAPPKPGALPTGSIPRP